MKILFLYIFYIIFGRCIYSQVTQSWIAKYNGSGNYVDIIYAMTLDRFGYIYVTGESEGGGINASDYLTIKYSPAGDSLWVRRYNGSSFYNGNPDIPKAIFTDYNANVYVTGLSYNNTGTSADCATIKYSSTGIVHWIVRYSGPANVGANANSIAVDSSFFIYITGISLTSSPTNADCMTIKYNGYGVLQWVATYSSQPNAGADYSIRLKLDREGNIYVAGYSMPPGGNYDIIIIKYSNSGTQLWAQRYNSSPGRNAYAYDLAVDDSGNSYIAATCKDENGFSHFRTLKYNTNGVLQWSVPFIGQANLIDIPSAILLDNSRNVYVAGHTMLPDTSTDLILIKYNNEGVQQWVAAYNGILNRNDRANAITIDKYGDIYAAGSCNGNKITFENSDFLTAKFNSSGILQWAKEFDGNAHKSDASNTIAVDTNLQVYSAGYCTFNSLSGADYLTIKYSQPIGIKSTTNNIPDKFELYQNYPNPFNPVTKIKFNVGLLLHPLLSKGGTGGVITLKIYDILGREITTLVNESLPPGTYEVDFDGTKFPSGTYFYTLITEGFRSTKAMILLK